MKWLLLLKHLTPNNLLIRLPFISTRLFGQRQAVHLMNNQSNGCFRNISLEHFLECNVSIGGHFWSIEWYITRSDQTVFDGGAGRLTQWRSYQERPHMFIGVDDERLAVCGQEASPEVIKLNLHINHIWFHKEFHLNVRRLCAGEVSRLFALKSE